MSRPSLVLFGSRKSSRNPVARRRIFFEPLEERCVLAAPTITLGTGGSGVYEIDTTFGNNILNPGLVRDDLASSHFDLAWDTAVQADGKIIAVGEAAGTNGMPDFAVVRYNTDGTRDSSFGGGDGVFTLDFPGDPVGGQDVAKSVVIQPNGSIVVAGYAEMITTGFNFAVIRLNSDGTLDNTFDTDGIVTTDFGNTFDQAEQVTIQADGKLVVVGTIEGSKIGVVRYNTNGSLDTGFDLDGKRELDLAPVGTTELAAGVAIQSDQIVVASQIWDGNKAAITRLNANGSSDGTFGTAGTAITTFPEELAPLGGFVEAVAIDGDKIVAVGSLFSFATDTNLDDVFVLRYNANGSLDNTFDGDGLVTTNFGVNSNDRAFDVVVQNGKILVAGESGTDGNDDFFVARYNDNGSPDTTFAPNGRIKTDFLIGAFSKVNGARSLALTPTGGIVLAGQLNHLNGTDFLLARYTQEAANPPVFDPINENGSITLTGSYTTSSPDTTTITITWGDGTSTPVTVASGEFSISHQYLDDVPTGDPSNVNTIIATIVDTLNGSDSESTSVTVNNLAPVAGAFSGPSAGVRNQPLTYTGSFTDVGTLDTHPIVIDWGDNTTSSATVDPLTRTFTATHAYASTGNYTVSYTLADDDTGQVNVSSAAAVNIAVARLLPAPGGSGDALFIGGTGVGESIAVTPSPSSIEAFINSVSVGVFSPTAAIVIYAGSGDDDMQISGCISLSAWLFGGGGDDRLKGGAGHDVLLGQDGNDLLVGGSGRDILIGGQGGDRIVGNADDDILVAGTTSHDANIAALAAILAEWTSSRSYSVRTANLTNGSGSAMPANGSIFLTSATVQDDGARDVMTGSTGFDWFFADLGSDPTKDKITDLNAPEFAVDLEFIES